MTARERFVVSFSAGLLLLVSACTATAETQRTPSERWYVWSNEGKPAGYFHVERLAGDAGAPVVLKHDFQVKWRGERVGLKMETRCMDDPWLSPVRIACEGQGEEANTFVATIVRPKADSTAGKLTATIGARRLAIDLPEHTVTDFAMFEIVRTLPFDPDKVFEFHSLEASELNLKHDHKLVYVGTEELEIDGRRVKLHKFEETGRGIRPVYYWVSAGRELVRVLIDGRKEFLLTTREKAIAAAD